MSKPAFTADPEQMHDAALDMYDALEALVQWYGDRDSQDNLRPAKDQAWRVRDAMLALAKADGRS